MADIALEARPEFMPSPSSSSTSFADPWFYVVVGCGGTGSYLIRDMARFIAVQNETYGTKSVLVLVDGDQVETRNLVRQNFTRRDISMNKAQVLADRYRKAFDIPILSIGAYLPSDARIASSLLLDAIPNALNFQYPRWGGCTSQLIRKGLILIGCVDNTQTRQTLHELQRTLDCIYLDAGNRMSSGQTVLSFSYVLHPMIARSNRSLATYRVHPRDVVELYDLGSDGRHPDALSCAEHAASDPQLMGVNMLAAQSVLTTLVNLEGFRGCLLKGRTLADTSIRGTPYDFGRYNLWSHVVQFDCVSGTIRTQDFEQEILDRLHTITACQRI
jgi:hypothetical protein